jgi:hypothetical protein
MDGGAGGDSVDFVTTLTGVTVPLLPLLGLAFDGTTGAAKQIDKSYNYIRSTNI